MAGVRAPFATLAFLLGSTATAWGALTPNPVMIAFPDTGTGSTSAAVMLTLTNTSGGAVKVESITTGGNHPADFKVAMLPQLPISIGPGVNFTISVIFSPTNGGLRQGTVQTVVGGNMDASVALSGTGIGPKITIKPSPINIGGLPFGQQPPPLDVAVTNSGGSKLSVKTVTIIGPDAAVFSLPNLPGLPALLGPNVSLGFKVGFTPIKKGAATATLVVTSDDPNTPTLNTPINGSSGEPILKLDTGTIIYGNQRVMIPSQSQEVNITNPGFSLLQVTDMFVAGANAADFVLTKPVPFPSTIPVGGSVKFSVVFNPGAAGARAGQVVLKSSDPNTPTTLLPMQGSGTVAMAAVMPNKLDFGMVKVKSSGGANFTVTNSGNGTLKVNAVMIGGAGAAFYSTNMNGGFNVPAAVNAVPGSVVVQVSFTPTMIGAANAVLALTTDDPKLPSFMIPLTGIGTSPMFKATPLALDFGSINVGEKSAAQTCTLSNTGTQALTITQFQLTGPQSGSFDIVGEPQIPAMINPGANVKFTVTFTPMANMGEAAQINIKTDDPNAPSTAITLNGFGRQAAMEVSIMDLNFDATQIGYKSNPKQVVITNNGDAPLALMSVKVMMKDSPFSTDFKAGTMIKENTALKLNVVFTPLVAGTAVDMLEITPVNPSMSMGLMPAVVKLTGLGVSPNLSVTPTVIDFSSILVGQISAPQTITIRNGGTKAITISELKSKNNDMQFGPPAAIGALLQPKEALDLLITFSPAAKGDFKDELEVWLQGASMAVAKVAVSGSGVEQKMKGGDCSVGGRDARVVAPLGMLLLVGFWMRRRKGVLPSPPEKG
ncbi:MAG: choice-of-anchor D domain-containing protein [Myxococcales bacterium]|nr:choice-of-anchor D domain-containing protein [Myxococcales bacterium]